MDTVYLKTDYNIIKLSKNIPENGAMIVAAALELVEALSLVRWFASVDCSGRDFSSFRLVSAEVPVCEAGSGSVV